MCVTREKMLATQPDPVKSLQALIRGELKAILSEDRPGRPVVPLEGTAL
jgi:hypothetical protein